MSCGISEDTLMQLLNKHTLVPGASLAVVDHFKVHPVTAGLARLTTSEKFTSKHFIQCASLSKTVAAAFAHEYFGALAIPMTTSVNDLLRKYNSEWLIESTNPAYHADDVTLSMLLNHTALGMHYVYGILLTGRVPSPLELLNGSAEDRGYEYLRLERPAGTQFSYSGGGFVVMQYLLELIEGRPLEQFTKAFLNGCGLREFTFTQRSAEPGTQFAFGHKPDPAGRLTEVEPLAFPPLAAGALCTPSALAEFLCTLARAYHDPSGYGSISHATALHMLSPQYTLDLGAIDFMGAEVRGLATTCSSQSRW